MAQSQNGNGNAPREFQLIISDKAWAQACEAAGYALTADGKPIIGISSENEGFLVALDSPVNIDPVNLARAICSLSLRVGQAKVKAKGVVASRELAQEGANSVVKANGYSPARDRENDILEREAKVELRKHVAVKVAEAKPGATEDDINATYNQWVDSEAGVKFIKDKMVEILARGTYTLNKKGDKASVVSITL